MTDIPPPGFMKASASFLLALCLLLITAERLPAPIVEEATPKPVAPKQRAESKRSSAAESGMRSRSVQVVFTENTRAALLYLKNYEGKPFSDVRPDEILEQLRQALSTRFASVSILTGTSSARNGGLTLVFDLQAHVGSISFTSNTISFIATFKNDAGRTIQTISASGKSTIPYPAFGTQFPKAVSRAFADFSQKLNASR